ncbi:MAG: acyltransferase family protein [Pseudomonadota bacterium]
MRAALQENRIAPTAAEHYRADIDGLRAVAVLAVIAYHAFPGALPGGFVGVDVFFVISGYLITGILAREIGAGTFTLAGFYARRVRRILPALAIVLAFALAAGWLLLSPKQLATLCRHVVGGVTFSANLVLWNESGYFDTDAALKPLLHLWSLAIEEQFYLVWPLALLAFWRWRVALTVAIVVASLAACIALSRDAAATAFFLPHTRAWELLAGALLVWLPPVPTRWRAAASLLGALAIGLACALYHRELRYPGAFALAPTLGAALLIAAGPGAAFNRLLARPAAAWVGRISYPLYLWHWPLLVFALILNDYDPLGALRTAGVLGLTVALSALTYLAIEQPIRRQRRVPVARIAGAFASLLVVAGTAWATADYRPTAEARDKRLADIYADGDAFDTDATMREACNFHDPRTKSPRAAIDPACTPVGAGQGVFLLWGDSHAQALWYGFDRVAAPGTLALIAASACPARLDDLTPDAIDPVACRAANRAAREYIRQHRPQRVFIAQREGHEGTDWRPIARFVRAHGGELVLVGPSPQWLPSLPLRYAQVQDTRPRYLADGLDAAILRTNARLRATYPPGGEVRFVSLIDALCNPQGCLAMTDSSEALRLLVRDYGHLTPAGSETVARLLFVPLLR